MPGSPSWRQRATAAAGPSPAQVTQPEHVRRLKSGLLPTALFVVAFGLGTYVVYAFRANGGVQDFYQPEFGPAVMLACGRGYHPPDVATLPQLKAFLQLERDRFDCASLPADVPLTAGISSVQRVSRYLEVSVAATWRIVGLSWPRLALFGGLLLAAVVTLSYSLARVALSPLWSLAVAAPLLWSPLGLSMLPHYRDYAKAPFILAMILLMARLVTGTGRVRTVLGLAALGGGIAGFGLGFRNDELITIVPFVIVLLALARVASSREWLVRLGAAGVFALTFVIVARPVLSDYSEGSNTGHVILLGLMKPFDAHLGVEGSVYDLGSGYDDSLAFRTIYSYAQRIKGRSVAYGSIGYDRAAVAYLTDVARVMPGDLLTRTLGAIQNVPAFFLRDYLLQPSWVTSRFVKQFYAVRELIQPRLARLAALAVGAAILVVAGRSTRVAIFLVLVLIVFVGGTAMQFHERHFFHLEFIPWWAFGFLGSTMVTARPNRPQVVRAAVFAAVCLAATGVAVVVSRAYQHRQMRALFETYLRAPRSPLTPALRRSSDGLATEFLVADLRGNGCPLETIAITLSGPGGRTMQAHVDRAAHEPTRVFFASYTLRYDESVPSVAVEEFAHSCLERVDRVDVAGIPLLLNATLEPGWRGEGLHQRLASLW